MTQFKHWYDPTWHNHKPWKNLKYYPFRCNLLNATQLTVTVQHYAHHRKQKTVRHSITYRIHTHTHTGGCFQEYELKGRTSSKGTFEKQWLWHWVTIYQKHWNVSALFRQLKTHTCTESNKWHLKQTIKSLWFLLVFQVHKCHYIYSILQYTTISLTTLSVCMCVSLRTVPKIIEGS